MHPLPLALALAASAAGLSVVEVPALLLVDAVSHNGRAVKELMRARGLVAMPRITRAMAANIASAKGVDVEELAGFVLPPPGEAGAWLEGELLDESLKLNEAAAAADADAAASEDGTVLVPKCVGVLCESDEALAEAEALAHALGVPSNAGADGAPNAALRDKGATHAAAAAAGVAVPAQALCATWAEAAAFLDALPRPDCVVKPRRGAASTNVHLCASRAAARRAFDDVAAAPLWADGAPGVVVQEFVAGDEFAVDTVSRDGVHKCVAIWRYEKRPCNGAPFVYYATRLCACTGAARAAAEHALAALDAVGLRCGPSHTEVIVPPDPAVRGPVLVEVNARWHAASFSDVTAAVLGVDALAASVDAAVEGAEAFAAVPRLPAADLAGQAGLIAHFVSNVQGTVAAVRGLEDVRALPTVRDAYVYAGEGEAVERTVDIRTDAGQALLWGPAEAVEEDFEAAAAAWPGMWEVE